MTLPVSASQILMLMSCPPPSAGGDGFAVGVEGERTRPRLAWPVQLDSARGPSGVPDDGRRRRGWRWPGACRRD